jgi:hypothetical protein
MSAFFLPAGDSYKSGWTSNCQAPEGHRLDLMYFPPSYLAAHREPPLPLVSNSQGCGGVAKRRASDPAPLLSPRFASQNRSDMAALTKTSKRSRLSAGILAYRKGARGLEVLLVHPGGPFWRKKDDGAWSIPKGEIDATEDAVQAARRVLPRNSAPAPRLVGCRP